MAEWDRTDVSYSTRVKQLGGSLSGGLNGSYFLSGTTVSDDNTTDVFNGGAKGRNGQPIVIPAGGTLDLGEIAFFPPKQATGRNGQ